VKEFGVVRVFLAMQRD